MTQLRNLLGQLSSLSSPPPHPPRQRRRDRLLAFASLGVSAYTQKMFGDLPNRFPQ
jgi:hypothetical protein